MREGESQKDGFEGVAAEQRQGGKENKYGRYKATKKEVKFVVTLAKMTSFEDLYEVLQDKDRDEKLYSLARARKKKAPT